MSAYRFPYLSPHQSRRHEPTAWQMELASALESIFAKGAHSLDEVVDGLNASRIKTPDGGPWTADGYKAVIAKLGTEREMQP